MIREIDATNFDINSVKVVRLAYQQKRFSYACDYIRLKWIYDHGGIYFDLDVEVIKDMRDIVDKGAFFGFDGAPNGPFLINTGSGFGAPSGCPLLLELMALKTLFIQSAIIPRNWVMSLKPYTNLRHPETISWFPILRILFSKNFTQPICHILKKMISPMLWLLTLISGDRLLKS